MPGHSKRRPNPNAVKRTRKDKPAYEDMPLVNRIADRIRQGVPESAAGMCEGLSRPTVSGWRYKLEALLEEPEPNPPRSLVKAVEIILRARGEAEANAAIRAHSDPKNAPEFWLERRAREDWKKEQTVQVEGIDPSAAVALALAALTQND